MTKLLESLKGPKDERLDPDAASALAQARAFHLKTHLASMAMTCLTGVMGFLVVGWPALVWMGVAFSWLLLALHVMPWLRRVSGVTDGTRGEARLEMAVAVVYHIVWASFGPMIWFLAPPQYAAIGLVTLIGLAMHISINHRFHAGMALASLVGPALGLVVVGLHAGFVLGEWPWTVGALAMLGALGTVLQGQLATADELRRANANSERLLRRWDLAGRATRLGLWEFSRTEGRLAMTPSLRQMVGLSEEDVLARGDMIGVLCDEPWRSQIRASFQEALDRGDDRWSQEYPIRRGDGGELWIETTAIIERDEAGAPLGAVGLVLDVTERRAAEREAMEASRAKSAFLATMSHEIRTPLNGVIAVTGVLERTDLTPAQGEMVALIRSSGRALERLLSDFLDMSRIEAGKIELEEEPFDLVATAESAAYLHRLAAQEKGLAFDLAIDAAARGMRRGDSLRVRQILHNLISNAVKFTTRGRIDVAITPDPDHDGIVLTVADTGIGFAPELAAKLFDRFEQADRSITRSFGGSGLGLSIVQSLAGLMGGVVSATSTPGVGSRFVVRLPLPRTDEQPAVGAPPSADGPDSGTEAAEAGLDDAPASILLAEDHEVNRRVVALILEPLGIRVTFAHNGLEAVEAFRNGPFDLVLMDMMMPEMDGLAATRAIRLIEAERGMPRTPVAMLSANALKEHVEQAMAAGCDLHIAKPVTPEGLMDGLARAADLAARREASGDEEARAAGA